MCRQVMEAAPSIPWHARFHGSGHSSGLGHVWTQLGEKPCQPQHGVNLLGELESALCWVPCGPGSHLPPAPARRADTSGAAGPQQWLDLGMKETAAVTCLPLNLVVFLAL